MSAHHLGQGGPDEYQTPRSAIDPLLDRLPWADSEEFRTILEPAAGNGNIVRALHDYGYSVVADDPGEGTVGGGRDFVRDGPCRLPGADAIITNPPWSLKDDFLRICIESRMHWALLLPVTALGGARRQALYRRAGGVSVLMLGGRTKFERPDGGASSPHVEACWICSRGLLPEPLVMHSP
jgi:hypothetical protein